MTSDQRIWAVIIIRALSCFPAPRLISLCTLRHRSDFALNWPFIVCFFWHLSPEFSFLFDPEKFRLLTFCKSVGSNSWLHVLNSHSVFMSIYSAQLSSLSCSDILSLPFLYSAFRRFNSSQPHPSGFSHFFWIVLQGFTKTAICQGHRLHFAICCKIKLGGGCVSLIVWAAYALYDISFNIRPDMLGEMERDDLDDNQSWDEHLHCVCVW